jgi:hypothetical protein
MVISDAPFTVWVPTLRITLSKSSLHALYLGGALSKSQCMFVLTTALFDLI